MKVQSLKPDLNFDDRAFAAINSLIVTLEELRALSEEMPDSLLFYMIELDKADDDITMLRTRLKMKRSTADLCSKFGRAP